MLHPDVLDVAVLGIADAEMGEQVKAVVQPRENTASGPELADRLLAHCRRHLAGYKCPRSVEFTAEPLRTPAGKVRVEALRRRFGSGPGPFGRRRTA